MTKLTPGIAPGAHIELRDAVWRVVRVDPTSSGLHAWSCVGVSEIVRDQEAVFLQELEGDVRVLDPVDTQLVRDTSPSHRAGRLYLESLLRDVPPPDDGLYVGHRAALDVLDFQLDPAWQALQRPRQRILVADAVGLGKTLEAGILLSELIRRGRARRILVATVKSMLTQLQKELWCRFSIPLVRLDSVGLQRIRATIPTDHNPFHHFDRAIISIDTLKQNNAFRAHVEQARWDVIVIDEAHNVAVRGGLGGRSQRARIAQLLAGACDHLILLSATPHDGKPRSFASLMTMLDPTAIADPDDYGPEDIRGLYVRRFKAQVQAQLGAQLPERVTVRVRVPASPAQERAYAALAAVDFRGLDQSAPPRGAMLVRTTLEKALLSSPAACLETIDNRCAELRRRPREAAALAHDLAQLAALRAAVAAVTPADCAKLQRLVTLISEQWGWSARTAKTDRIVVFTERLETLAFLAAHLPPALGLAEHQWARLHGGLADTEQQAIVEAFGKESEPVRLLLASDVASEGLNLHYLSHRLVHFDVPWSLMRFQQRNGRVDRYGQPERPEIVYLLEDIAQPDIGGDARVLEVLIRKDEQAQKNIADPSAFQGAYDADEEEWVTARAIETKQGAGAFEAALDANLDDDPFAALLDEPSASSPSAPLSGPASTAPRRALPSLFESDFDYLRTGLTQVEAAAAATPGAGAERLSVEADRSAGSLRFSVPADLARRLRRLPPEVRPRDGALLLTTDPARMQAAMAEARRAEHAWPEQHFLWPLHPVLDWLGDRARAAFPRHAAPVLVVRRLLPAGAAVVIVSGLLPNRRAQPLVHRWYAARFAAPYDAPAAPASTPEVLGFSELLATFDAAGHPLVGRDLPNHGEEVATAALRALLPAAIGAVAARIDADRAAFVAVSDARLNAEVDRLAELEDRQRARLHARLGARDDALAVAERAREERRISQVFGDYADWVRDALTPDRAPFLQVVGVLVGAPAEPAP